MSATGSFANTLSERAALLAVVAGAVETVPEEDGLGVKVAGREPVEAPEVEEIVGSGVVETVEDVLEADVFEAVATEATEVLGIIGPGASLNRRINKKKFYSEWSDLRNLALY